MDTYRNLKAWQHCYRLALAVYDATDRFPNTEQYGLTIQLRQAAVSPCANLAEGYTRRGQAELKRFAGIALASLSEVDTLLLISQARGYMSAETYKALRLAYVEASKTTFGLIRKFRR